MKKFKVDFGDLTPEMIKAIAMMYRDGFKENDVISFSKIDTELEDRIKIVFNDTLFFIKQEIATNIISSVYNDEDFQNSVDNDENCDAEYC